MKTKRALQAKILRHSQGLGVPTPELVRQRATEIAKIDGRNSFNEQDWQRAKVELHGGHLSLVENGDDEPEIMAGHDMIGGTMGHHTENLGLDDADNIVEELISEGMDEAVHDRMLEASKSQDDVEEI